MEILCVIPARGGSKSIPGKNIVPLDGKPILAYSIQAAKKAKCAPRIVVSTDDDTIAEVANLYGADIVKRPSEISGDKDSSESALLHTLDHLKKTEGYVPEILIFLQCTSPLTLAEDIDGTVDALINDNADSALSVTPFHYFLWSKNRSGNSVGINHSKDKRLLRQDLSPQFLETGAVYVMKVHEFQKSKNRFVGTTAMYVMPTERCLEIDEPSDIILAETRIVEQKVRISTQVLPNHVSGLVFDFDGVLTNNLVLVSENGCESVICDRSDGMGISKLRSTGLPIIVISSEVNSVVKTRCEKLGIPCFTGVDNKLDALKIWANENELCLKDLVYVGNDINDLECMREVGCGVAVNDAHPDVISQANIVLSKDGGRGAVREISELVIRKLEVQS
tara:strand:- start:36799 stop:37977 length:1179 start_codon:yes stop_codon:yes gene_type:complete